MMAVSSGRPNANRPQAGSSRQPWSGAIAATRHRLHTAPREDGWSRGNQSPYYRTEDVRTDQTSSATTARYVRLVKVHPEAPSCVVHAPFQFNPRYPSKGETGLLRVISWRKNESGGNRHDRRPSQWIDASPACRERSVFSIQALQPAKSILTPGPIRLRRMCRSRSMLDA